MELYHHGIKGQRWGVRRYQNYDGTRKQLNSREKAYVKKLISSEQRSLDRQERRLTKKASKEKKDYDKITAKYNKKYSKASDDYQRARIKGQYEHRINKEREEAIAASYKLKNKRKESEYLINSYKNYTPQDISDDKKEKAKGLIKTVMQFVPVVGTVIDIADIPSTLNDGVKEQRMRKAYYYDYKNKGFM